MQRRKFISLGAMTGIASALTSSLAFASKNIPGKKEKRYQKKGASLWPICLDTATIRPAIRKAGI